MRRLTTLGSTLALLLLASSAAFAASSKLDPHARAALAQLQSGASVQTMRANRMSVSNAGDLDVFITGSVSRTELEAMGVTVRTSLPGVCTAYVPAGVIDQLALRTDVSQIRGATLCEQSNNLGVPLTGASALRGAGPAFAGLNGAGVLVGDVDSGIDIHHGDFQDPSGLSRILYLWDQNNTTSVVPPSGYTVGHEWLKADIDGGLCTETDASAPGHGSHVMGTIAGDGSKSTAVVYQYAGMAPKANIAMVATTFYDTDILDGVNYIFQKATALGENAVVNLSLGSQYGPHDGSDAFEMGLDALSGPGRLICVAAGNDAGTNIHGGMLVPAAGDSMKFTITGGTTNGRGCEFNGWYNAPDSMTVKLRSPGNLIITLAPGTSYGVQSATTGWPTNNTGVNGRVYIENGISTSSNGAREIYLIMQASGTGTGGLTGTWTVYCVPTSMSGPTSRVDMYRDYVSTTSLGAVFSLKNTNDHMVAEPACARNVVTVGAFQSRYNWLSCAGGTYYYTGTTSAGTGAICSFSNVGPTRDGVLKPEIVAPGSAIISTLSADLTSTYTACGTGNVGDGPAHQLMSGTSMATPYVAGAVALLFQKFGALTPAQVKTYLAANATVDSYTGAPWNGTYGNGKLHLGDLIDPTVTVTYPNGGEVLYIGAPAVLTWNSADNVGVTTVDLYLSRSGVGGPWETIATAVPNTGSYSWTVTAPITGTAYLQVVAHDAAANTATDMSDAAFQIINGATATLLSTFVANTTPKGIELRWQLANPGSFTAISVERATSDAGPWDVLAAPVADADGFTLVDQDVVDGQSYLYRLQGVGARGTVTTLGQITGTAGQPITEFALTRIAPNPSRGQTSVEFTVPRTANIKVAVLDVQGREIATLANGQHAPGRYQLAWSGDAHGRRAASGLYFVRMQAPGVQMTRRVIISR